MGRYCYSSSVSEFLRTNKEDWLEIMQTSFAENSTLPLDSSQINAWKDCYDVLQKVLPDFDSAHPGFAVIFEYQLPYESGRRPDVVLLSEEQVIILEFKMKLAIYSADLDQCTAYGRDIREYHYESRNKEVIDALVLTKAKGISERDSEVGTYICSGDKLGSFLEEVVADSVTPCDVGDWVDSAYEPLPTIVEAARMFMKNEPLPNIRRVNSTGIPDALECLTSISKYAEENSEHIIAFVTGVPGAGKTFLGLQFVYDICKENNLVNSVYLSGNGPLVEVLTDALKSKVFVKDLHSVINEFLQHKANDFKKNIIVFDEGQRAWDVQQMAAKQKSDTESEPDVMIRLCEERLEWCVLLILVGEGQEIYKGENSGIEQWNDALNKGSCEWKVVCPDKLKHVFEADQEIMDVEGAASLDLTVSLRTHLAGDVSSFANNLIDGDIDKAKSYVSSIYKAGFSMFITRDLQAAKDYCDSRYSGNLDKRYGLIASSKSRVLPKFGVDNSFFGAINRGKYGKWFNTPKGSGKSCCDLEKVVTEFGVQGLELDMPIVCWDSDMIWNGILWERFKAKEDKNSDNNVYRVNSYRVLLTRGRDGFIIFVPPTEVLDPVYEMFRGLGIKELETLEQVSSEQADQLDIADMPFKASANSHESLNSGESLREFFDANGLLTIDKRPSGGCLWVLGDEKTIGHIVDEAKTKFGAVGGYASGKQTTGQPGWWTKTEK